MTRIRDYIEKTYIHGLRNYKNKGLIKKSFIQGLKNYKSKGLFREDLYSWT